MATKGYLREETLVGVHTHLSPWSHTVAARLPIRPYGPRPPTGVGAIPGVESIILRWTPPTHTRTGEPLRPGAIAGYRVYYSTSSPVTTDAPYVFVNADQYIFVETELPNPPRRYFAVVTVDRSGNTSDLSEEVSAVAKTSSGAPPPAVDDYFDNVSDIIVGRGRIFLRLRPPKSSWVRWSHYNIYYQCNSGIGWPGIWTHIASEKIGHMHAPLNLEWQYKYKVTVVAETGEETEGTVTDAYTPNAEDQGPILADVMAAQYIIASHDIVGQTLIGGTLQSLDWGANSGSQFNLMNNGHIKLGGSSSPKFHWDGTTGTLSIVGSVVVTGGDVPYTFVSDGPPANADNTKTIVDGGLITTGTITLRGGDGSDKAGITGEGTGDSSIRIWAGHADPAQAPFRVTQGGTVTMTNATITGSSFSGIIEDIPSTAIAGWAHPSDPTQIDGGAIYTGTITAAQIAAGTITANEIASEAITGNEIAAQTLTATHIQVNTIDVDSLSGYTLTGRTVQTASSGRRAVMSPTIGTGHTFAIYDSNEYCALTLKEYSYGGVVSLYHNSFLRAELQATQEGGKLALYNSSSRLEMPDGGTIAGSSMSPIEIRDVKVTQWVQTEVHNDTAPTTLMQLDLTGAGVPSNRPVMVCLEINNSSSSANCYTFGHSSSDWDITYSTAGGSSRVHLAAGKYGMVIVPTDGWGKVWWKATYAYSTRVTLLSWW